MSHGSKNPAPKVIVKRLGRTSGNLKQAALEAVVRDVRDEVGTRKLKVIGREDTATGSGHVRFRHASAKAGARAAS